MGLRLADEFEAWGGLQVHLEVTVQEDVNANRPTHAEAGLRASVVGRPNVCAGTDKPLYRLLNILGGQGAFEQRVGVEEKEVVVAKAPGRQDVVRGLIGIIKLEGDA